jgi:hypothetical protein
MRTLVLIFAISGTASAGGGASCGGAGMPQDWSGLPAPAGPQSMGVLAPVPTPNGGVVNVVEER